jgi:hypothetical protein
MRVTVPISIGELLDKITILEIKAERIGAPEKRAHVAAELALLAERRDSLGLAPAVGDLVGELAQINRRLWDIEDRLRRLEQTGAFGPEFVRLARSVYQENDRRAEVKRRINEITGSELIEEKSYSSR